MKLKLHNKDPKIFKFHIFGLKCCLYPVCLVKALQDDISVKLFPSDWITLYKNIVQHIVEYCWQTWVWYSLWSLLIIRLHIQFLDSIGIIRKVWPYKTSGFRITIIFVFKACLQCTVVWTKSKLANTTLLKECNPVPSNIYLKEIDDW